MMMNMAKEKILILGGGFSGVKAALELVDDERFAVTLLSDETELRYYPTLFHTATGGSYANSSIPLREIFQDKAIKLAQGRAVSLDRKTKSITTDEGTVFAYDTLIIGLGVVTNYFGIPGMDTYAFSIKSQDAVQKFKAHLHEQMRDERRPDLHYVIVGGGPTGIELAGALPGYIKQLLQTYGINDRKVHVDLVEAAPRLLPRMTKRTSRIVARRLRRLGVRLYLGAAVQAVTSDELTLNNKPVRSHTVVWTAGVTNHPFFKDNNFVLMGRGKVAVDTFLQAEENIYVIGDNANTPYSGLAQTALHDGIYIAKQLKRRASGKTFRSYMAKPPITVIPVGPYWAAVSWNGINLQGKKGWVLRQAADLIGFHDLQPWPKAAKQFLTQFSAEDSIKDPRPR
jgi:NADH:ubiquinone reductase (H+-translocating)